jgi:hypothetical protein
MNQPATHEIRANQETMISHQIVMYGLYLDVEIYTPDSICWEDPNEALLITSTESCSGPKFILSSLSEKCYYPHM